MKKVILFLSIVLAFSSCDTGVAGNGNVIKKDLSITEFSALEVNGAFEVMLRQGTGVGLSIEMDENLFEYLEVTQRSNVLKIETERVIRKSKAKKIYLTVTDLEEIEVNGANELETRGGLNGESLMVQANGASQLKIEFIGTELKLAANGGSSINLRGEVGALEIEVNGAAKVKASKMRADHVKVEVSGAAESEVWAVNSLDVSASGASDVKYKGEPEINKESSGASNISRLSNDEND